MGGGGGSGKKSEPQISCGTSTSLTFGMDIPELVEELPADFTVRALHLATVEDSSEYAPRPEIKRKIPLTIVTGYLGLGKLTLLDVIGRTSNKRLAIILNEFGDTAAIEKSVTIQDSENGAVQEWLDLGNGCLCCTVKNNGVLAIENLIENSGDKIDYILLETTGVADPAPIAKMFWLDEALASSVYIDGVVTVVDAANITECLEDVGGHWHRANGHLLENLGLDDVSPEEKEKESRFLQEGLTTAHLQIALADCILLNKVDLVDEAAIKKITAKLKRINASAPIHETSFGDIALDKILDLHAFEASSAKLVELMNLTQDMVYHDDRITTVSLDFPFFDSSKDFANVEKFLQKVLWESLVCDKPVEIHRLKGILVHGDDVRVVQGVRDTYDIIEHGRLHPDIGQNKLVFIGKDLVKADLEQELRRFLGGKDD